MEHKGVFELQKIKWCKNEQNNQLTCVAINQITVMPNWQPKCLTDNSARSLCVQKILHWPLCTHMHPPFMHQLIYAHAYVPKPIKICIHVLVLSIFLQYIHLVSLVGYPPPPHSHFLLPAEIFGWLKYAHRLLRDSPWRMALRATPIRFSPFDKFIAGILKMKLEGRLLETVFPAQVP